jgi:ABC-2 type transport system ATP-binding protein
MFRAEIAEAGYERGRPIVRGVGFEIRAGERVGLLGPNGAGKSTIVKGLLGQLPYWQGRLYLDGEAVEWGGEALSTQVAYIPEQPILYERLTLWEHLALAAAAAGLPEDSFRRRADALLRRFRLHAHRDEYPVRFSKGMQQKTMLAIAFLLRPRLYLVDEPFIGLDPGAVLELLAALDEERARGAAVLLTTHVLDSAERLCDRFVLIVEGKVAASGTLDDVRAAAGCGPEARLFDCFARLTSASEREESP